jgi:hypothetical protein
VWFVADENNFASEFMLLERCDDLAGPVSGTCD